MTTIKLTARELAYLTELAEKASCCNRQAAEIYYKLVEAKKPKAKK